MAILTLVLIRIRPSGAPPHRVGQPTVHVFSDIRGSKLISQRLTDSQFVEGERSLRSRL